MGMATYPFIMPFEHIQSPTLRLFLETIRVHFPCSVHHAASGIDRKLPSRRKARKLADGGPVKRRTSAEGLRASGRADTDLRRADRALAWNLRSPHMDRP